MLLSGVAREHVVACLGGHGVLFLGPLDLHNHRAVGKRLATAGDAFLIRVDHLGIPQDRLQPVVGLTRCNRLPRFISSELGKRDPVRRFQRNLSCAARAMLTPTERDTPRAWISVLDSLDWERGVARTCGTVAASLTQRLGGRAAPVLR